MHEQKLGIKTLSGITEQITELLSAHSEMLNVAYIKHGDEKFSISFKCTITSGDSGGNKVETAIAYRPEPDCKDSTDGIYDEYQISMFSGNDKPYETGDIHENM